MIERVGLNFNSLPEEDFDDPLGRSTGAAVIFGATGGVMEAALRTAVETLTGKDLPNPDFTEVRGTKGIKEATYHVAGMDINVAVASGLANARELLEQVKSGEKNYHFIEIMGCPGGCVNGGGQPKQPASVRNFTDIKALRAKALYTQDANMPLRKSHENPAIKQLYKEYLEKPGSHKAHEILHTTYVKRTVNQL
jgi:NADP-reducing hydrogenase subunit HndD